MQRADIYLLRRSAPERIVGDIILRRETLVINSSIPSSPLATTHADGIAVLSCHKQRNIMQRGDGEPF